MPPVNPESVHPFVQRLLNLQNTNDRIQDSVAARAARVQEKEMALKNGGPGGNLSKLPGMLQPGNVGDLNRVIWPFWFTFTPAPELAPGESLGANFAVTQEAAFVVMAITKTVHKVTAGPVYTYVDPDDESIAGQNPGLSFYIRDAQSSRVFMQTTVQLDHLGAPRFPTVLAQPMLFLPNSVVEAGYSNAHPTDTYVPFVTMFGYRLRIEDAENIRSLVTG